MDTKPWLAVCAAVALSACARTAGAQYYPPPESQGGWRSLVPANGTPTAAQKADVLSKAGLNWDRLLDAWTYGQSFGGADSLLVIRNGWVAGEWSTYTDARGIASSTKSLTGLSIAKLFDLSDAGRFPKRIGIDDFAHPYLPAAWSSDARKKNIRMRHLLTMSSGLIPYDGPYSSTGTTYYDIVISTGYETAPGTLWSYASVPIDLMSLVIEDVSGRPEKDFFDQEIGAKIGLPPVTWPTMGQTTHTGGSGGPGGGARFTTRSLSRVGYLLLNRGAWNGQQVVSAARVDLFTRWPSWLQNAVYDEPNFARETDAQMFYAHTFWTNRTQQALGTAVPADAYYMSGWGRQICLVIPSLNMVVVRLGANGTLNSVTDYYRQLLSRIMAAVANPVGTVTVTASDATASEPGTDTGRFTVSRTGSTSAALAVNFTIGGTATNGTDVEAIGTSVTIPAGSASATVAVTPKDDAAGEAEETVVLILSAGGAYAVGSPSSATVRIADNDSAPAAQSVASFTLVNADTNADLGPLASGDTLNLATLPTRNLNVRANTSPATVGSVKFGLDGNASYRIESAAPYALAGDTAGDYLAWTPGLGTHTVTATPYTGSGATGTQGTARTATFTVTDAAGNQAPTVSITSPAPGASFTAPATVTIQAQASDGDGSVTKVEFFADGVFLGQDSSSPYSYTWSNVSSDSYTLTARATDNGGAARTSAGVAVTVVASGTQAVVGFTLVNADTDQDIGPLNSGATIDLSALPDNLNVRANTAPSTVGSVRFALDGNPNFRTETAAPYALAGDTSGDYWPWTPSAGAHSLTATPWTGAGATGAAGTAKTITFTVVGQPSAKALMEGDSGDGGGGPCGALGLEVLAAMLLARLLNSRRPR